MMKTFYLMVLLLVTYFTSIFSSAEQPSQIIRGRVTDKDSKLPLVGVTLIIDGTDPIIGTTTDHDGYFKFPYITVGRHQVNLQYVGYESKVVPNIIVGAGKETVLYIELTESVITLDEVVVSARAHKAEALNKMSTVSARSFTVEETKRYAGGFNDPSRMAASFAGVSGNPEGENDIVIRGNSPRGMLWRLEGVEIPNPNHFAEEGASGGYISILNTTTLGNSDFFTGAFPAEYGNAYSGVFDIQMRRGNNEKKEYSLQAGVIGVDASMEGPFSKGSKASYLFNYRYSSLAMLNNLGIKIVGDAVPKFQDLTFKLNFPSTPIGEISVFGLGGISHIAENDAFWSNDFETDMGIVGINNLIRLNNNSYFKNTIAYTGSANIWDYQEDDPEEDFYYKGQEEFKYSTIRMSTVFNTKINTHHYLRTGVVYSLLYFDLYENSWDIEQEVMFSDLSEKGNSEMLQAYANWRYRPVQNVTFNFGLHYMQLMLNSNYSFEPRIGAKWQVNDKQSISAGYGVHSKAESLSNYLAKAEDESGNIYIPNKNLEFGKANHYVLGYDNMLTKNLYLKTEVYYQQLYNVPISQDTSGYFSALNHSWGYTNQKLLNEGKGANLGMELTLEKFFSKNYYFLTTASVYDSKYQTFSSKKFSTKYNGNYVFNFTGGKEFHLGKAKDKASILALNLRGIWAGGQRYTPIDIPASIEAGYTKRDWSKPYAKSYEDFVRIDFKVSLKREKKNSTRVVELDIQNVTNNMNTAGNYYNTSTDQIETWTQLGLLPVLSYRIEF